MNILTKWWNELTGQKAAIRMIGGGFQPTVIGGNVVWYDGNPESFITHGYRDNDIVYSAVQLVMDKVRVAPWGLYKVEDESSLKAYNALMQKKNFSSKDFATAKKLQTKALVPLEKYDVQSGKLKELLTWPNESETFADLIATSVMYEMLCGNSFWDGPLLEGGANATVPSEIRNLPAHIVQIVATRGFPSKVLGYQLISGETYKYSKERILHIKTPNPSWDTTGSGLYGQSPLLAASKVLKRSESAKLASVAAFENGGAIGVLYVDDERMSYEQGLTQIESVKRKWDGDYTGSEAFNKVAHSGYKTGFTKINDTLVDMNLLKSEQEDARRICNVYGIPSQLLNDPENKTYNNLAEAEIALTSRCAIPKLVIRRDGINRKLQTDWGFKGKNIYLDFNLSNYTELQEDGEKKWSYVSKLPVPTSYKLEMMELDVPPGPEFKEVLIPTGFERLVDVANGLDAEMDKIDEEDENI